MGTRFSNDSFQLYGTFNGGTPMGAAKTFRCLTDIDHDLGIKLVGPDSGATYDETKFVGEERPEVKTSIAAIETLTGLVSVLGQNCLTAGSNPGARAFMQSHNPCATNGRTAGSAHQQVTIAKAHLIITSVGGNRGATAYAKLRVIELSTDGEAAPDAIVYNAALPGSPIVDEEFIIGGTMTIGAVSIADENILGWTLDTGITINAIIPASSIYPTVVDYTKVRPTLKVQHDDASLCDAAKIPYGGLACTHANTKFFLQKRTPLGGLYVKSASQHLKFTMAGFARHTKRYQASGSNVGNGEVTIESIEGVGGVPLTVTPLQAIA
jgi:hypothetical protein